MQKIFILHDHIDRGRSQIRYYNVYNEKLSSSKKKLWAQSNKYFAQVESCAVSAQKLIVDVIIKCK